MTENVAGASFVAEDLRDACTLPGWMYSNPEIFEVEKERIFSRAWHPVCLEKQLSSPGDFVTFRIANEPLIALRDKDGKLNAYYNVCPHRGTVILKEESGNKQLIQCPYHAWTFNLDGTLKKTPNFTGEEKYDPSKFSLVSARIEAVGGLVFVNLDTFAGSAREEFEGFISAVESYDLAGLKRLHVSELPVEANWKIFVDNYLECDHCPLVHPEFTKRTYLPRYEIRTYENYSLQYGPDRLDDGTRNTIPFSYWLFPCFAYQWDPRSRFLTLKYIIPLDWQRTLTVNEYWAPEDSPELQEHIEFIEEVRLEDKVVCDLVQEGVVSRAYRQGKFGMKENGSHHFHLLVQKALSDDEGNIVTKPQRNTNSCCATSGTC